MKYCKKFLSKQQRQRLRKLGIVETLYSVSSVDELISLLPVEIKSNNKIFRLSIRNLGIKWCVQYVDFTDSERLLGYIWYATNLVDALYKAVKYCSTLFRQSL